MTDQRDTQHLCDQLDRALPYLQPYPRLRAAIVDTIFVAGLISAHRASGMPVDGQTVTERLQALADTVDGVGR